MKGFTTLEKDVTQRLIEFCDLSDESKQILFRQFEIAELKERRITGAGFFTDFKVPASAPRLTEKMNFHLDAISGEINGVPNAVAFILFIKEGEMRQLEGFTQAILKWSPYEGEP